MAISGILGKAQRLTQEQVVLGLSLALFLAFGIFVSGFLAPDNVLSLVQNVAILGMLGPVRVNDFETHLFTSLVSKRV